MRKKTTKEFVEEARIVHGDKYDYSKVNYVNNSTKVCIICPEHGEFWQQPSNHLLGNGCPKCSGKKFSKIDYIREANKVHNRKYDYSKLNYKTKKDKVCIICPEHGEFWQIAQSHLAGHGCPKCAIQNSGASQRLDNITFKQKACEVHNNRYDYSKVNYVNSQTKICIICPEHGEFWQTPNSHLNGSGCPKCSGKFLSNNEIIDKLISIHGKKYDFSKIEYISAQTKVRVICPEHGEFWATPNNLFSGKGCPKCGGNYKYNNNDFITRAKEIHGYRYDYSKAEYKNNHTKVRIICPEHGEFWQTPVSHLRGNGCPNCVGLRKEYKFNLLNEFVDEYRLRDFLMTNDENLIYVILRNIEKIDPKFNPIVNDIDRVLRSDSTNPIEDLEDKYRTQDETVTVDTVVEENNTTNINDIDLDDDDAIEAFISNTTTTAEKTEPTIDELTRARENEINLINSIEHMLTPEDRQFIKDKFLNDKRRNWMLERDKK